jgi:hypothetical protein
VTHTSAPVPATDAERPGPPFDAALVEELLRLLLKAVRAHQLYLHNNPTYLRAVELARGAFAPVWAETDALTFVVTETELRWEGVAVLQEPGKASDSLPWILYKDGLREVTLLKDFEQHELVPLLDILQRVRKTSPDEDDLLTMLWEKELVYLRYRYVDLATAEGMPLERTGYQGGSTDTSPDALRESAPPIDASMPGVVNMEDFDSALYFLEESEIEYLREEVRKEYSSELRLHVLASLLDIFEQQPDAAIREEICGNLDTMLLSLLASGQFRGAAFLLRESSVTAQRAREVSPKQQQQLLAIPHRLSDDDVLSQLLQQLDEASELPDQQDLNELFEQLRPSCLGTVLSWLGKLQTPRLRMLLENSAARLAMANTAELVRLVSSSDRAVALEAVKRAGSLKATAAVPTLAKLISDPDVAMRLAATQALGEIASPGALQLLDRTIEDAHRDVRVATARIVAARTHRQALPKVEALIRGKALREADLTEKMAMFEAYGTLCGDAGVSLLDGLLNAKGIFGRREDPELRACAAMALGRVGTEAALGALRRASSEKEVLVRNAVSRALRGGSA